MGNNPWERGARMGKKLSEWDGTIYFITSLSVLVTHTGEVQFYPSEAQATAA